MSKLPDQYYLYALAILAVILALSVILNVFRGKKLKKLKKEISTNKRQLSSKLFELEIFNNLAQKGYSINVNEVLDTFINRLDSQNQLKYCVASYILLDNGKALFRAHLKEGVSKEYISDIKSKMLESIKLVSPTAFTSRILEENITGAKINDLSKLSVSTFFNVPLEVSGDFFGVFTISGHNSNSFSEEDINIVYEIFNNAMKAIANLGDLIGHEKGKLQVMVDSMYDGVIMIDKNFRVLVVNPASYKLMGMEQNLNLNIFDVFDYFSGTFSLEEKLAKVFATGKVESVSELKIGDKYYEIVVIPVKANEDIIGGGILIHDQSEEMELRKLRQDFTAMMVHELRSPLTVIKGTSDLLIKEYKNLNSEQVNTFIVQIKDSAIALLGIVNELLDASKIEAGKVELFKKQGDINKIINDEFNYYYNLARDKGINFSFDLDLSIQKFYFDEQKIKQVLNNLLSNAIKFTDPGGTLVIVSKNYGSYIGISVNDSGKGVPDEVKELLFQKFVQARESDKSNEQGTGLGLVICKGIVEAHGGRIWIEDNVPKGAKFIFTLPSV
ncbi:hypothetical protein A3F07_01060 [candidate division WWE3 bacterium RIFCSPHIGHO2_12_FULL_38_15]|uniref:histidine kinase n=1 Tax=candidate division WWE3 bacterium RIFCSPHIGHO2_02_FULL_38_14 TaxID=1802620 RepID=A0A1F4V9X7_UNCKA|nr:MAG: hypothetical protein A2793_03740 [candidate division WWE3 bacterium RIFCSPHIGHO2_01_FULL_38_45]OGC49164.1 MAG: hypothetical protein A3F07_01060 [candidate division WWE3 bacterium RIFCSPHIGHO2_12_FULL_38_15]OGC52570.1 MAG: hypothetical protein A3B64_03345 [candidate division WWE3 bacterium RIFCSPLOWO2_01_FULL_37_24]OGC54061.1 MAG: hypothetical protein A3D91_04870 [candidate division WWE3 bacterium RIFCSPHIGHO2_02_FULL_38_14]HLB51767.1 PAS domain-containing sensor histidine kinase [Patesc